MKIATWNVNSLRVRLPHVLAWLQEAKPDVLALQEIKMQDQDFPHAAIQEAGYVAVVSGQKTYNGVAVLSREASTNVVKDIVGLEDPQRRMLAATINGVRIINLYVPNGESVVSDKYQYKLHWLNKLIAFLKNEIQQHPQTVILGDFNIAPAEIDVHDPQSWQGQVLFSDLERSAFQEMLQIGFIDCFRHHSPTQQAYSWWDYRLNAFKRNLGARIDHILASHSLMPNCQSCIIDKKTRALERPSDHAPVMAEFLI